MWSEGKGFAIEILAPFKDHMQPKALEFYNLVVGKDSTVAILWVVKERGLWRFDGWFL